jgi:hypothetical protein
MKRLLILLILLPCVSYGVTKQLTQEMLPYSTSANDTLIISGAITSPSAPVITVQSSNVVIMGDGGNDDTLYGPASGGIIVRTRWVSSQPQNFALKDLTVSVTNPVTEGEVGVTGTQTGTYALWLDDCNKARITNVSLVIGGYNGNVLYTNGVCRDLAFDDVRFFSYVWGYADRCLYYGSVSKFNASFAAMEGDQEYDATFQNCKIYSAPHAGLYVRGKILIEDCLFYGDARNHYYSHPGGNFCETSVDPFAIALRNGEAGTVIRRNNFYAGHVEYEDAIDTAQSNTGNYTITQSYEGTQGIFVERTVGTETDSVEIYDNYLYISNGPNDYEHGIGGSIIGGRQAGECYGTFWRSGPQYISFHDNTIIILVDSDTTTTWIGRAGFGAKPEHTVESCCPSPGDNSFVDNYIEVITLTPDTGLTRGVAYVTARNAPNGPMVVRHNTFLGSAYILEWGDANMGGGNSILDSNILGWGSGYPVKEHTIFMGSAVERYGQENYIFDNTYGTGVDWEDISIIAQDEDIELTVQSTYRVFVRGYSGNPVIGANVYFEDAYGNSWSGVTGTNGLVGELVSIRYDSYHGGDSLLFNDFTTSAWYGTDSVTVTKTVGVTEASKTDTITLTTIEGTGTWDAAEVINLTSCSIDSLHNDYLLELDSIEINYTTGAQTYDSGGYIILAWSYDSYPTSASEWLYGGTFIDYTANDTAVYYMVNKNPSDTADVTEPYTLYLSYWVRGETEFDLSSRGTTSISFVGEDEPEPAAVAGVRITGGRITNGVRVQ